MDQVDEVKQKTDIVAVVGEHVKLKKAGRNFRGLCPFHGEKTPSFMVSPELQIYKCFGCSRAGDVYNFLQEHEGMDFGEALKVLAERSGVKLKPVGRGAVSDKEKLFKVNELAAKFYQWVLTNHPSGKKALSYLTKSRKLSLETIRTFEIGFAPERSGALSKFLIEKKGFHQKDLERSGLTYTYRGRSTDRFRGRVIFPLHDHRGNHVGLAGRIMPGGPKNLAKYINSPETPIYHKSQVLYGLNLTRSEIKKTGWGVVVEGELDLIMSWQVGVRNVVAIKGTALTIEQVRLLARLSKNITLALDSDFAGDAAARRSIALAQEGGLEVMVALMGKYKDPDDFAQKDSEGFKKALDNSIGVWDFIINLVMSQHDLRTGEGKAKVSRELIPILAGISDKIVQAHYIGQVAMKLNVPVNAVNDQLENYLKKTKPTKSISEIFVKKDKRKDVRSDLLEKRLIVLLLQKGGGKALYKKYARLFKNPLNRRIVDQMAVMAKKDLDLRELVSSLSPELQEGFAQIVFSQDEEFSDRDKLDSEIKTVERELDSLTFKGEMAKLTEEISVLEKKGAVDELKKAQERFNRLALKMKELRV